jgi:hypothetical protein
VILFAEFEQESAKDLQREKIYGFTTARFFCSFTGGIFLLSVPSCQE